LDIIEKIDLIEKSPTEEIVTREELIELFNTISLTYF
jgi:tyrosyl-tRNA synthetase